jgi:hypothetical protein
MRSVTTAAERAAESLGARPPRVPWASFAPLFRGEFRQGQHVTIIGPNGLGKTTLALRVADARAYVLFLATKRRDPLYDELVREWGYHRVRELAEIETVEGLPRYHRYLYHPQFGAATIKDKRERQSRAMTHALNYAFDAGGWCVIADELLWLIQQLRLDDELEAYWYQARTENVSLVGCAQRPAWVPRAAYSQAKHIFLFKTADRDDQRRLGDIAGADVDRVRYEVAHLEPFEFLYVQPHVPGRPEGVLLRSRVELEQPAAHSLAHRAHDSARA